MEEITKELKKLMDASGIDQALLKREVLANLEALVSVASDGASAHQAVLDELLPELQTIDETSSILEAATKGRDIDGEIRQARRVKEAMAKALQESSK